MTDKEPTDLSQNDQRTRNAILDDITQDNDNMFANVAYPRFYKVEDAKRMAQRGARIMFGFAVTGILRGAWQGFASHHREAIVSEMASCMLVWLGWRIYSKISRMAAWTCLIAICLYDWQLIMIAIMAHLSFLGVIIGVLTHQMINCVRATHAYWRLKGSATEGNKESDIISFGDVILLLVTLSAQILR